MTDETSNKLPERQWDGAAEEVFKAFMRKIEAKNGGDKDKCWPCPMDGKELPDGYSASRDKNGYGQFTLSEITKSGTKLVRQKTFGMHRLSYQFFKFDREILGPAFADAEWAVSIGKADHVRHYQCSNPSCVNWHHLELGDNFLNVLDREIEANKNNPLSETAIHSRQKVIDLWNAGTWRFAEIKEQTNVKPWEVHRILKEAGVPIDNLLKQLRHSGKVSDAETRGRQIMAAAGQIK